ncbi:MAG: glycosyl hydrolase family 62 [Verrucomicrobiales bacterium]|nr:glycosyl hydrolase family 62 [Verrucomicrobiales bacterium]MCP5526019.1 glycosyl hydrolase family 62 [Verrucomicrobiales bacterium]
MSRSQIMLASTIGRVPLRSAKGMNSVNRVGLDARRSPIVALLLVSLTCFDLGGHGGGAVGSPLDTGEFDWSTGAPVLDVGVGRMAVDRHVSVKDPTVVFHGGRWHLFTTLRMASGRVDIAYLNFPEWSAASEAPRHTLALHDEYYCAPQVFYFTPHRRWYLIYQLADKDRQPPFGPCFSTTTELADPGSWSKPQPMVTNAPDRPKWLDFWVICDDIKAHLFYTSLDGHLWRRETPVADFPFGWSEQVLALEGDIFEASHTYKLRGQDRFLTLIEAQAPGRRYYKLYLADRLDGSWRPVADSLERPFAARENVLQAPFWTDSISHGELLRAGVDERLEVDPENLRFLFQGATEPEYRRGNYGQIPWRLGLLEPRSTGTGQ